MVVVKFQIELLIRAVKPPEAFECAVIHLCVVVNAFLFGSVQILQQRQTLYTLHVSTQ